MKSLVLIATALLLAVPASSNATELSVPEADGWYSWEVASGSAGRNSCCYHWRSGSVRNRGCALDGGDGGFSIGDCDLDSEELRVYVLVRGGSVDRIRALSSDCPVTASSEIQDLGQVDVATSIGWLRDYLGADSDDSSEVMAAMAMHAGEQATAALIEVVEDGRHSQDYREEALFWLVQSESDSAYRYLDELLGLR